MDRIETENVANELSNREANGQHSCMDICNGECSRLPSSKLDESNLVSQFSPVWLSGRHSLTV